MSVQKRQTKSSQLGDSFGDGTSGGLGIQSEWPEAILTSLNETVKATLSNQNEIMLEKERF